MTTAEEALKQSREYASSYFPDEDYVNYFQEKLEDIDREINRATKHGKVYIHVDLNPDYSRDNDDILDYLRISGYDVRQGWSKNRYQISWG